jgi:hypothetical protein
MTLLASCLGSPYQSRSYKNKCLRILSINTYILSQTRHNNKKNKENHKEFIIKKQKCRVFLLRMLNYKVRVHCGQ